MPVQLFAQIYKVDEAQRLVTGRAVQEVADNSGEIFDYASSKPYFEEWSATVEKSTSGKSLGNVRSMHSNVAAGKIVAMNYDDAQKAIDVSVKVIDDNEWEKVLEGVHTGFSIGGKYVKKWQDGELTRYTANPNELSLVDRPCIPTAQFFDITKADGSTIQKAFKSAEEKETIMPTDTVSAIDTLAAMLDKGDITPERLIELAKADKATDTVTDTPADKPVDTVTGTPADVVAKTDTPADTVPDAPVEKGMYTVANLAGVLDQLSDILQSAEWETEYEGDNSPVPAQLRDALKVVAAAFVSMAAEEAGELSAGEADVDASDAGAPAEVVEQSDTTGDLQKAGAAISKANAAKIQAMHDTAASLGATCGTAEKSEQHGDLEKVTKLGDDLQKALSDLSKVLEANDALAKRVAQLEAQPLPGRPALKVVSKGDDLTVDDDQAQIQPVLKRDGTVDAIATAFKSIHSTGGNTISKL